MRHKLENLLEETVAYSTVTELREKLLSLVEKLTRQPLQRHIITRHGKPEAVLMSFPVYETLRKLAKDVCEEEQMKDRETALKDAIARMKSDYGMDKITAQSGAPVAAPATAVAASARMHDVLKTLREDLLEFDRAIRTVEEEKQIEQRGAQSQSVETEDAG